MKNLIKFEANKTYTHGWIGNSEMKTDITILKRTAKTATIKIRDEDEKRCKIHEFEGVEKIYPYGKYSMCSILSADKPK